MAVFSFVPTAQPGSCPLPRLTSTQAHASAVVREKSRGTLADCGGLWTSVEGRLVATSKDGHCVVANYLKKALMVVENLTSCTHN
jgi:hypothetical protein